MNKAEEARNAKIAAMDDAVLLVLVTASPRDEAIRAEEWKAFAEMAADLRSGARKKLSPRQRAWAEEAARKVMPFDLKDVPVGRPVPVPAVLQNLPKKPPGRV